VAKPKHLFLCSIQKLQHFKPKPQIRGLLKIARMDSLGNKRAQKSNVLECLITWYNFNLEFVPSVSTCGLNKDKPYIIA